MQEVFEMTTIEVEGLIKQIYFDKDLFSNNRLVVKMLPSMIDKDCEAIVCIGGFTKNDLMQLKKEVERILKEVE